MVYYQSEIGNRIYHVAEQKIISNEDWSYLEETLENMLVLIICVENESNLKQVIICKES